MKNESERTMRFYLIVLVIFGFCAIAWCQPAAHYRKRGSVLLNDITVTPGVVRTISKAKICNGGSTDEFRHTTEKMKNQVYAAYGVNKDYPLDNAGSGTFKAPLYEIDHLISLELGGADDVENLWPQPYYQHPGAHEKDAVENWLHKQICEGSIEVTEAQRRIATDWYALYIEMNKLPRGASGAN